jgi:hypothetical protein
MGQVPYEIKPAAPSKYARQVLHSSVLRRRKRLAPPQTRLVETERREIMAAKRPDLPA